MCFSPTADFVAAGVVGVIGVATLRQVRRPRDLVIGALPLLFAAHQFVEGFVWLGLRGQVSSGVQDAAAEIYLIYAQAILPMLVPLGFLLLERSARHRRRLWPFLGLGVGVGLFLLWHITQYPIYAEARPLCVAYTTHSPYELPSAIAYVIATCGPALLSSRRYLRWFGVVNVIGLAMASTMRETEFTSAWCVYAALASILILLHFRRDNRAQGEAAGGVGTATEDGGPPANAVAATDG